MKAWYNGGSAIIAYERAIALAMVRDGVVFERYPLRTNIVTVGQLLEHLDAVGSFVTCNSKWTTQSEAIKPDEYYTVFAPMHVATSGSSNISDETTE